MSQTYSPSFKESVLRKAFSPDSGKTFKVISEEAGIPYSTLMRWRKESSTESMTKPKANKKEELSAEEKFNILEKKAVLSEPEFGELLRQEGLLLSEVEDWKKDFLKAFESSVKPPGRPKKDPELKKLEKENKRLERNLNYKDKALAEMSARVILIKKSQKLFGLVDPDEEDDY